MQFNSEIFVALQEMIQQIVDLKGSGLYSSIDGLTFDEGGVNVSTSHYACGDNDYESDYYTWSELNQGLGYFTNLFEERAKAKEIQELEREQIRIQTQQKNDEAEFERLKQKLGK